MKSPNNDDNIDEWDDLLDGKPSFNQWDEANRLLYLLANSSLDEEQRDELTAIIISEDLGPEQAQEIAESLRLNQQHFSNIPNPNQTMVARFISLISKNIK